MIYSNEWLNSNHQNTKSNHQNTKENTLEPSLVGGFDLDDSFVKIKDLPSLSFEKIMNQLINSSIQASAKEAILNYDPTGPIPFPKPLEHFFQSNQEHDSIDKVIRIEPEACIDFSVQIPYTNVFRYLYDVLGSTFADYPIEKLTGQIIVDPSVLLSFYQDINYDPNQNSVTLEETKNFLLSKQIDPFMVNELHIDLDTDGLTGKTVCTISMTRFKNESNLFSF